MKSTQKTTQILRVIFMQENLKNSLCLTAGALAVATSLFAGGAQATPSYMAVLPIAGLDANQALRPVDIALASGFTYAGAAWTDCQPPRTSFARSPTPP
jgi:hypothetical protein